MFHVINERNLHIPHSGVRETTNVHYIYISHSHSLNWSNVRKMQILVLYYSYKFVSTTNCTNENYAFLQFAVSSY